ncbi:MAG: hypothetical protein H6612_04460 [Ignavibacteriales bacterium]|nr:hypothetical protein [Ignavibacteriales bacterium]
MEVQMGLTWVELNLYGGAIGPNHLVSVTNTSIAWFYKNGANEHNSSLSSFFSILSPLTSTFDPKVIYDQYDNRFVVVTLERTTIPSNTSKIFLAVSQTDDPNDGWYFYSINSLIQIDIGNGLEDFWADYPGFAVGENAIFITNNMFSHAAGNYGGGRLWVVDKGVSSGLYFDGSTPTITVLNPQADVSGTFGVSLQPAHMFGTPPSGAGTFLAGYSGLNDGVNSYIEVYVISNSSTAPTVIGHGYTNFGPDDTLPLTAFPTAPQMGSVNGIMTNDRRTYNAVCRNNILYVSTVVLPPSGADAGQATAHWIQINATDGSLIDDGNIGAEDLGTGTYTFFPSVAVNALGEMLVGFAASGPSIYPGAYYAFRYPFDVPGTIQSTQILKEGVDYYYRTFSGTRNRWGDYTGSAVDPTNDITFCIFNQYAQTRGTIISGYPTQDGRWGTLFGILPRLQLKVLLEGPWNGTEMNHNLVTQPSFPLNQPFNTPPWNYEGLESVDASISASLTADWILITLRKDLDPLNPDPTTSVKVASRAALLWEDGNIFDIAGNTFNLDVGFTVEPGEYYIEVQHRNHLAIMSSYKINVGYTPPIVFSPGN